MSDAAKSRIPQLVLKHEKELLSKWISRQLAAATLRPGLMSEADLRDQSQRFLALFRAGLEGQEGGLGIDAPSWSKARELLSDISKSRARQGFTPSETATFVFSLKEPLFDQLRADHANDADELRVRFGRRPCCSTSSASSRPRSFRRDTKR